MRNGQSRRQGLDYRTRVTHTGAVKFVLDSLESRLLMCSDHGVGRMGIEIGSFPALQQEPAAASLTLEPSVVAAPVPVSTPPALNSKPGAHAKLYLDFNGDTTSTWGSYRPGTTPAFDTD